jgi:hypothetical protein
MGGMNELLKALPGWLLVEKLGPTVARIVVKAEVGIMPTPVVGAVGDVVLVPMGAMLPLMDEVGGPLIQAGGPRLGWGDLWAVRVSDVVALWRRPMPGKEAPASRSSRFGPPVCAICGHPQDRHMAGFGACAADGCQCNLYKGEAPAFEAQNVARVTPDQIAGSVEISEEGVAPLGVDPSRAKGPIGLERPGQVKWEPACTCGHVLAAHASLGNGSCAFCRCEAFTPDTFQNALRQDDGEP